MNTLAYLISHVHVLNISSVSECKCKPKWVPVQILVGWMAEKKKFIQHCVTQVAPQQFSSYLYTLGSILIGTPTHSCLVIQPANHVTEVQ